MLMYSRIFIWGSVGSGKTTLARKISKKTQIDVYTLGDFVYKSYPEKEFSIKQRDDKLQKTTKKRKWIIEGVYSKAWILPALKKADFVIILDVNKCTLFSRIIKRALRESFQNNHTNLKTLAHKLKLAFNHEKNNFISYKNLVKKYRKKFVILKNNDEIDKFIKDLGY